MRVGDRSLNAHNERYMSLLVNKELKNAKQFDLVIQASLIGPGGLVLNMWGGRNSASLINQLKYQTDRIFLVSNTGNRIFLYTGKTNLTYGILRLFANVCMHVHLYG